MRILIKVARAKNLIDFRIYNHDIVRAVTYRELENKLTNEEGMFDLVLLEEINEENANTIRKIKGSVKVALVCGKIKEYEEQVKLADSLGIDIITQAGEVPDYIMSISGVSARFTGVDKEAIREYIANSSAGLIEETESNKDKHVKVEMEDDTDTEDNDDSDYIDDSVVMSVLEGVEKRDEKSEEFTENNDEVNVETEKIYSDSYTEQINGLKKQIETKESEICNLTERLRASEVESESLQDEILDLKRQIRDLSESTEEQVNKEETIDKSVLEAVEAERDKLKSDVNELKNSIDALNEQRTTLIERINELENEKKNFEEKAIKLEDTNRYIEDKLNELNSSKVNDEEKSIQTEKELQEIKDKVLSLRDKIIDAYNSDSDYENTNNIENLDDILESIKSLLEGYVRKCAEVSSLKSENSEVKDIGEKLKEQISGQSEKIQLLENKVSEYEQSLDSQKETEEQLKKEISLMKTKSDEDLKNAISIEESKRSQMEERFNTELNSKNDEILRIRNECNTYSGRIKDLQSEVSNGLEKIMESQNSVKERDEKIKSLEAKLKSAENKLSSGTKISAGIPDLNEGYTGKAKIINVFGIGSCGKTTVAMTLANRLMGKRVCVVDLDFSNPKGDVWLGMSPVCSVNIPGTDVTKTGVALLFNKGAEYIKSNYENIVKHKVKTNSFVLDYISGVYTTIDQNVIYETDWTSLFNYIGNMYEYIVVDSGRLGSCDAYDAVIRTISSMAYKNVVVSAKDKGDIRTLRVKMNSAHIELDKCIWVMNMCKDNIIDDNIKNLIGTDKTVTMFMAVNYYGTKKPIDVAVPMVKATVDELVKYIQ